MAKKYEVGGKYYLPVTVSDVVNTFIRMKYLDGVNNYHLMINDMPDLLLTAEEVYAGNTVPLIADAATLKSENERLSRQNEELGARVEELTDLTNYYIAERQRNNLNIRLLLDKIAELEGENNG